MLNKSVLMGRLVADPELRATPQGTKVTGFTLAVNRSFTKQGEQPQADFIDIVAWGKTAEFVCKYFNKGQLVAVAGRIQTRMWEDKQGNKRKSVEIVAEEVHFAEPKRENRSGGNQGGYDPNFDPMAGFAPMSAADESDLPF